MQKKPLLHMLFFVICLPLSGYTHWNWDHIDPTKINGQSLADFFSSYRQKLAQQEGLHDRWLWGVGSSAQTVEGNCTNNNWSVWPSQTEGLLEAGVACDHWNRYKEDIQLIKALGVNSYRFSIEWSKVEPSPGVFDQAALDHYKSVCQECLRNDIIPVVTLFQYTEPLWFYNSGSWEKEENIAYFVEFAQQVFSQLHEYVHLWITFNVPEAHAMRGWFGWPYSSRPPAKKDMQLAAIVLKNLLEAHVQVYRAFKSMKGGDNSRIGIIKNLFQLEPWHWLNPYDQYCSAKATYILDKVMLRFLKTGSYHFYVPGIAYCSHQNESIKPNNNCLDFIGLNYYGHTYLSQGQITRDVINETPTDNPLYTMYAEGFYNALKQLHDELAQPLNIPIYVTENGIATKDNSFRTVYYQRYLYSLAKAISEGCDVRGYVLWSFMDSYEWGTFEKRYGLYHVNFDTQERTLRPSAAYYIDLVKASLA